MSEETDYTKDEHATDVLLKRLEENRLASQSLLQPPATPVKKEQIPTPNQVFRGHQKALAEKGFEPQVPQWTPEQDSDEEKWAFEHQKWDLEHHIRASFKDLAINIAEHCPNSGTTTLAIRKLQEAFGYFERAINGSP